MPYIAMVRALLAAATLLAVTLSPLAAITSAQAYHEDTLIDDVVNRYTGSPPIATDGETVVWAGWTQTPGGPFTMTLKGATLPNRQPLVIAGLGAEPVTESSSFDIDGDRVVWDASTSIYMARISTGQIVEVVSAGDLAPGEQVDRVRIRGSWVVWISSNESTAWVRGRQIDQPDAPIVTFAEQPRGAHEPALGSLAVGDGWVSWGAQYDGDLRAYRSIRVQRIEGDGATFEIDAHDIRYGGEHVIRQGQVIYPIAVETAPPADVAAFRIIDLATQGERVVSMTHPEPRESPADVYPYVHPSFAADGRYIFQPFVMLMGTPTIGSVNEIVAYDTHTGSTFVAVPGDWMREFVEAADGVLAWVASGDVVHAAHVSDLLPSSPRPAPEATMPELRWFPETGHTLSYGFRAYWETNGGLPVFGYPLTEEFREINADTSQRHTVQYFERQRYEWHPENAGTTYEVLLGRLGAELLMLQGRNWQDFPAADPSTAHFVAETGQAIDPRFWDYWSSHGLELGDPGVSYRESVALFGFPISPVMMETNADGDSVLTQYFERAVFEWHPVNPEPYRVLLRRLGAEMIEARGW